MPHWDEWLFQIQNVVDEKLTEGGFHRAYCIQMAGALAQNYVTNRVPCLEYDGEYLIPLTKGNGRYDLPVDIAAPLSYSNNNQSFLQQNVRSARRLPELEGSPIVFRMGPKKMELYPIPGAYGNAFTLQDTNADSTSSAYFVLSDRIVISIGGGVNQDLVGTIFLFSSYPTMGLLVAAINAWNKKIVATLLDSCPSNVVSNHLLALGVNVPLNANSVSLGAVNVQTKGEISRLKYLRESAIYGIRLRDANTDSTSSNFSVSETGITLTVTGGVNDNTAAPDTVLWTAAATVGDAVTAINALSIGISAEVCDNCPAETPSVNLDVTFVTVPLKASIPTSSNYPRAAFLKPEIPIKLSRLVIDAMYEHAKLKSLEIPVALQFSKEWKDAVDHEKAVWVNERNKQMTTIRDAYKSFDSQRMRYFSVVWF